MVIFEPESPPPSSSPSSESTTRRTTTLDDDDEHGQQQSESSSSSSSESSSFISFLICFYKSKGTIPAVIICTLLSYGIGITVGIVPEIMTDQYARYYYGYSSSSVPCYEYVHHNEMPIECIKGADDAQQYSAYGALIQNLLILICNPLIGSKSDQIGRRKFLCYGFFLCTLGPMVLLLLSIPTSSTTNTTTLPLPLPLPLLNNFINNINPIWYYIATSCTGIINFMSIVFASISDSVPTKYRSQSFGFIMAGFYGGFALSPMIAVYLNSHYKACLLSFGLVLLSFLYTLFFFPETLPSSLSSSSSSSLTTAGATGEESNSLQQQQQQQQESASSSPEPITTTTNSDTEIVVLLHYDNNNNDDDDNNEHEVVDDDDVTRTQRPYSSSSSSSSLLFFITKCMMVIIKRPFQELMILNSNPIIRMVAIGSFFSSMVYAADLNLVLYYIEDYIDDVRDDDIAKMFFVMGILGIVFQALLLQPLLRLLGEKGLLVLSFLSGTMHNALYGLAHCKSTIYVALSLSQLTKTNYPILSSLASKSVTITTTANNNNNNNNTEEQNQNQQQQQQQHNGQVQGALFALNALAAAIGPVTMQLIYNDTSNGNTIFWGPGTMFLFASLLYFMGAISVSLIPVTKIDDDDDDDDEEENSSINNNNSNNINDDVNNDLEEPLLLLHRRRRSNNNNIIVTASSATTG